MSPRVTICVPTIGRAEYLQDVRVAVERQTYTDYEVLVLDNASQDDAVRQLFAQWAAADDRVRLLRIERRIPMFANFNRGIAAARAPFVVFFHDDDVQEPRLVERAAAMLESDARITFVGSNYDFIDETGAVTERRRWIDHDQVVAGEDYIRDLIRRGRNLVPMPGLVFRREAIRDGFDESLPIHFGDFTLLMRLAERRCVGLLQEPLVRIRRHEGQASTSMPLSRSLALRTEVLENYLDELAARRVLPERELARLRRRVKIQERLAMAYGWYVASDPLEAQACGRSLTRGSRVAARALDLLESSGARRKAQALDLARVARKLAPRVLL